MNKEQMYIADSSACIAEIPMLSAAFVGRVLVGRRRLFNYSLSQFKIKTMFTNKVETKREISLPVMDVKMAIDNKPEYKRQIFDRPTTEEYEKKKKEFAYQVSQEMITAFTPEDRFDIFNEVRRELEKALRQTVEEMAYELDDKSKYFEGLKGLIY